MPNILTIKNTLLSLRGEMVFLNQSEHQEYVAKGQFSLFNPTLRLFKGNSEIAQIKKKLFSWSTKYFIVGNSGDFILRRKSWSWTRKYLVLGGPLDGAMIIGGFWDTHFEMTLHGKNILRGDNQIISIRDTCHVTFFDDNHQDTLAAILVAMRIDKKNEDSGSGADFGD